MIGTDIHAARPYLRPGHGLTRLSMQPARQLVEAPDA